MTTKLEQAARQALEALESCEEDYIYDGENEYECDSIDWDKRNAAITALREALAEQAGQKLVAEVVLRNQTVGFGRTEERKDIVFLADVDVGTKLYAAPVRTKDLTDAEIATLVQRHTIDGKIMPFALCEAVIAADREKNK